VESGSVLPVMSLLLREGNGRSGHRCPEQYRADSDAHRARRRVRCSSLRSPMPERPWSIPCATRAGRNRARPSPRDSSRPPSPGVGRHPSRVVTPVWRQMAREVVDEQARTPGWSGRTEPAGAFSRRGATGDSRLLDPLSPPSVTLDFA